MKKKVNLRLVESDDPNIVDYNEVLVLKNNDGSIKGLQQRSATTGTMTDLTPNPDKIENNKDYTVTNAASQTINPTSGKIAMKKVTLAVAMDGSVTVNVPAGTYAADDNVDVTYTATLGKIGLKSGSTIKVKFT